MSDRATAMILAMFAADSLALGAHWIYDTDLIDKRFGRVERYLKPDKDSYHGAKGLGEFTHYGDQALCLLASLAENNGFSPQAFAHSWKALFSGYAGYYDQATKATLSSFDAGKDPIESGSSSSDLGGASRIGPLVYCFRKDEESLVSHAKAQTAMTHNNPLVIESGDFFSRLTIRILNGAAPVAAINDVVKDVDYTAPFTGWIEQGIASVKSDTRSAISEFGQMCETPAAFPSVIHLIVKYENNLKEALIENVMAGGDSAARGLLVGMALGAHSGPEAIPPAWLSELKAREKILEFLSAIDRV